ncbi:unnamed protein product, partial [Brenthis ino]
MVYSGEPHSVVSERKGEARPLGGEARRGRCSARGALWRVAAAEACGAALLVALGCLPGCAAPGPAAGASVQRALAGGLTVAALVQCLDHVSGAQLNPVVSLAAALAGPHVVAGRDRCVRRAAGRCRAGRRAFCCCSSRARLRYASLNRLRIFPCINDINLQALAIETLLGGVLALANLAAWDARNRLLVGLVAAAHRRRRHGVVARRWRLDRR